MNPNKKINLNSPKKVQRKSPMYPWKIYIRNATLSLSNFLYVDKWTSGAFSDEPPGSRIEISWKKKTSESLVPLTRIPILITHPQKPYETFSRTSSYN